MLEAPKATLSPNGKTVHLSRGDWAEAFPVQRLASRLAFYRGLRDRRPVKEMAGRNHDWPGVYGPVVAALERVEKLAKVMGVG
jgi:hypothetical protein